MADKKFGQKRVCTNCEVKFYDLNKKSPLSCPHCNSEIALEDEILNFNTTQANQQQSKPADKDEFADIENSENNDVEDDVISLDDATIEEEQNNKN